MDPDPSPPAPSTPTDLDIAQYSVVAARRLQFHSLVWLVSALSLVAQAFLMSISLNFGVGERGSLLSSLLAIVVAVLSIQLMLRHRAAELADARWLAEVEERHGAPAVASGRDFAGSSGAPSGGVRSFDLWLVGLLIFGLAAVANAILNAVRLVL